MSASSPILAVNDLSIDLFTLHAGVRPVDKVSYSVAAGETLAIVGESGSGKTVLNFFPLGLMPLGVSVSITGSIRFDGKELVGAGEGLLRKLRGGSIGVIFQDPMSALNPARTICRQIAEVAELHLGLSAMQAEARALDLLKMVRMSDPEARLRQYPHELSGGLRQRVMIAIAIAAEPKLLIADEPTTALDVTVQAQIISLLRDLQKRLNMAMVLITHDMGVVAGIAARVAVMYAGRVMEYGPAATVLTEPRHPYTRGLIDAIPRVDDMPGTPFRGLPGSPPVLSAPIKGCAFASRCRHAVETCQTARPPLAATNDRHVLAACPVVNGNSEVLYAG
ncbi:ABC transporter ATP-binding protein [Taklimakanibacter deserti]|uniref:ABC transporter ATP-binding protein n=1 Tax=Taklimakanibacter deserti TaxID=2267839 RepID=UPI000E6522A5